MPPPLQRQLSFEIEHAYENLDPMDALVPLGASVKVSGEISIPCNLVAGERVLVVVSSADGEVIGQAECIASPPSFVPVEDKDIGVLGLERQHKVKVDR